MPNSNQARGIGTNQINVFGKVLVQKKFGDIRNMTPRLNLMGNLGIEIMTAPVNLFTQNDLFLYGLAGIYRVSDHVNIASEVNGRMNTRQAPPDRHREYRSISIGRAGQGVGAQIRCGGRIRPDAIQP